MPTVRIDNHPIDVPAGTTVLQAAAALGIEVPTLCHVAGQEPITSCMICLVRINGGSSLLPACGTAVADGMSVQSQTDQVIAARRAGLELLLGDHLGDCMGPCHTICPANMNIPLMIRQIAAGRLAEAVATVKADIAMPAVLGRICPAPCERGCRRREADAAVSICLLKRYVADVDLASAKPYLPPVPPASGRKVAIVGAGPAGLSAAWRLRSLGHACEVLDDRPSPGGALRYSIDRRRLPEDVLDAETARILALGVEFARGTRVGRDVALADLRRDFDAVLVAAGTLGEQDAAALGLPHQAGRVVVGRDNYQTGQPGLFAAGNAIRPGGKLAVRASADGKEAAVAIDQYLRGQAVTGPRRPFNVRIGQLLAGEIGQFMQLASAAARIEPAPPGAGLDEAQARAESLRCLHCDCRKADACKLRTHSDSLGADSNRFQSAGPEGQPRRRRFEQHVGSCSADTAASAAKAGRSGVRGLVHEPGKCIDCGICVRLAAEHAEPLGLTFVGRGFDVRVAAPFGASIDQALTRAAAACVLACPTGALAFDDRPAAGGPPSPANTPETPRI